MSLAPDSTLLREVFGPESIGKTAEECARTSKRMFVRSQVQIAPASPEAKGQRLTAYQALDAFGWNVVYQCVTEGSAPLVRSPEEPAKSLARQRAQLGLTVEVVAKAVGVDVSVVRLAETAGEVISVHALNKLAQTLALDDRKIGFIPDAGKDAKLGIRLREMTGQDEAKFGPKTVLGLAEAAWVIARQATLQTALGPAFQSKVHLPAHDRNYGHPPYSVGYALASRTREILGIPPEEPISSLRMLIEDDLCIPLVQERLDQRFAGATLANGKTRGIVVNESGMNQNVWVRRMTLSHELGHLLWDSEERLEQLRVDAYSELDEDARTSRRPVEEVRANAFAVAFLAPPAAIKRLAASLSYDPHSVVAETMTRFGIGGQAAKHHVMNVADLDTTGVSTGQTLPEQEWTAAENMSVDLYPDTKIRISRLGRFAWLVAKHRQANLMSADTAASYLQCTVDGLESVLGRAIALGPQD